MIVININQNYKHMVTTLPGSVDTWNIIYSCHTTHIFFLYIATQNEKWVMKHHVFSSYETFKIGYCMEEKNRMGRWHCPSKEAFRWSLEGDEPSDGYRRQRSRKALGLWWITELGGAEYRHCWPSYRVDGDAVTWAVICASAAMLVLKLRHFHMGYIASNILATVPSFHPHSFFIEVTMKMSKTYWVIFAHNLWKNRVKMDFTL